MSDAVRIEQRLQDIERRLHDLFDNWRRAHGNERSAQRESPREMEEQAVQRLFGDRHGSQGQGYVHDVKTAREMERRAVERLYGRRSKVVTRLEQHSDNGGS